MITTEDRARAAMRAIGDTVRDAPPLELAPVALDLPAAADEVQLGGHGLRRVSLRRPGGAARPDRRGRDRRWRSKLAPIAAAVAVAAVAIALVTIKDARNGRVASPSPSTTSTRPADKNVSIPGVPEYYVAWMQASTPYLVVGDTATGKQVGEVVEPHRLVVKRIEREIRRRTPDAWRIGLAHHTGCHVVHFGAIHGGCHVSHLGCVGAIHVIRTHAAHLIRVGGIHGIVRHAVHLRVHNQRKSAGQNGEQVFAVINGFFEFHLWFYCCVDCFVGRIIFSATAASLRWPVTAQALRCV